MIGLRQEEIESETVEKIDDALQTQHLKDIAQEPIKKECPYPTHGANEFLTKKIKKEVEKEEAEKSKPLNGKAKSTLSITLVIPIGTEKKRFIDRVIELYQSGIIKEEHFKVEEE